MATLNLTKVAVGCRTIEALGKRIAARTADGEVRVVTRMRPRRADELIGGHLYWIVRHRLVARQRIIRIDERSDGRIDLVVGAELEMIVPRPRRGHQGWRYLEQADAPGEADSDDSGIGALPPALYSRLLAIALV